MDVDRVALFFVDSVQTTSCLWAYVNKLQCIYHILLFRSLFWLA